VKLVYKFRFLRTYLKQKNLNCGEKIKFIVWALYEIFYGNKNMVSET